jgi:hypothetical protein
MNKEFIPYEEALALKELGFNEPCFTESNHKKKCEYHEQPGGCSLPNVHCGYPNCTIDETVKSVPLPLYQQAFRWFRDRKMLGEINPIDNWDSWIYIIFLEDLMSPFFVASIGNEYKTYQEAQLECLRKLITIMKYK